ncbi:MAG TPA: hypothetical protein VH186_12580 [Chloroflexia bacterium]|nr:hypothetical protein [Chloroflexia bacterium]
MPDIQAKKTEKPEVEVASLRRKAFREKPRYTRWKLILSGFFGLLVALSWHFIHGASENYSNNLSDPAFWFHLAIEGLFALYGAALYFAVWSVIERFRRTR